ncbi:MAG: DUF4833 domain-containing protein [Bacteroidetes bacterium]|nr:DUF4833 domain-containing protein [Bacteroidota bacterium]
MGRIYRSLFYLVALLWLTAFTPLAAQDMAYPVPPHNPNQLFYLQRPPNTNTLIYELNLDNGVLNKKRPIHVYWISYAKKGQIEELTDIQRKYAYGIKTTAIDENSYECYLAAYKKLTLYLKEGEDKRYHIYTTVNNKQLMVSRIFIAVNGGTLFKPNIDYVELTGIDLATGLVVEEKISL